MKELKLPEKNIDKLLKNLDVQLNEGCFVFVSISKKMDIDADQVVLRFEELEGTTYILPKRTADNLKLSYDFEAAWITLNVHSSLDAVGFTAEISKILADENISANIVAAYYHDHIFVPNNKAEQAVKVLRNYSKKKRNEK